MKRFLSGDEADAERAFAKAQRQRLMFLEARASSSFVLGEVQA